MNNNIYRSPGEAENERINVATRRPAVHRTEYGEAAPAPPPVKKRRRKDGPDYLKLAAFALAIALICGAFFALGFFFGRKHAKTVPVPAPNSTSEEEDTDPGWNAPDYVDYQPIIKNEYSRPDIKLEEINAVVVHYVADPTATAAQTRSYFNNLAVTHYTWASSHFVVGLEGEVLQIIPLTEWAYCSNERNKDTVSIECCHPEEDGKFTDATYDSLVQLVADLCIELKLDPRTDVIRHYDVTGKICPKYFVDHEDAWREFLTDVAAKVTAAK